MRNVLILLENGEIDLVLYLQHYAEGWSNDAGGFAIKHDIRPCLDDDLFYRQDVVNGDWYSVIFKLLKKAK